MARHEEFANNDGGPLNGASQPVALVVGNGDTIVDPQTASARAEIAAKNEGRHGAYIQEKIMMERGLSQHGESPHVPGGPV